MTDIRPLNCRHRLQDEGKSYPRSGCHACGKTIMTGLGRECSFATTGTEEEEAFDNSSIDAFVNAMKAKMDKKRDDGRRGWHDLEDCSSEFLSLLLREHVEKGDPLDVAILAMMLHQRQEKIGSLLDALRYST